MPTLELRCPVGPRKLLAKMLVQGVHPQIVDGNLIELSCDWCRTDMRKKGNRVSLVTHRYDLAGDLVESVTVDAEADITE